ncbi:MAG TPA: DUF1036 domain-containing protein [Bryobacteraceae bacterium]|nr:DUF1036 domain-containing protein [Bryobacteraceae bacterium]
MGRPAVFFLAILPVVASSTALAQDFNFYSLFICNDGQITVDVATALNKEKEWHVRSWTNVSPGQCEQVLSGNWVHSWLWPDPEIHVVLGFKDSTGAWGAGTVDASRLVSYVPGTVTGQVRITGAPSITQSNTKVCLEHDGFRYPTRSDPAVPCSDPGAFLMPAAFKWAVNRTMAVHVAFGPNDRASRVAVRGSEKGAEKSVADTTGPIDEFTKAMQRAAQQRAADQQKAEQQQRREQSPAPVNSPPADDPIRTGGFITPPPPEYMQQLASNATKTAREFDVHVCTSRRLYDAGFFNRKEPGSSEMVAFTNLIKSWILANAEPEKDYNVSDEAFRIFSRARSGATPSTPDPRALLDIRHAERACDDLTFLVTVPARH